MQAFALKIIPEVVFILFKNAADLNAKHVNVSNELIR